MSFAIDRLQTVAENESRFLLDSFHELRRSERRTNGTDDVLFGWIEPFIAS